MIRFDDESHSVTLSVRDVADDGDYRFSGPAPLSLKRRALLGREVHEDHQGEREEELSSYRRERGVRFETEVDGWRVVVTGRIDGIYTDEVGRTVIEEVKTIVASDAELEATSEETFPAYTRQLQLYRFLLEEGSGALGFEGSAPQIALHLYLIALPSRASRVVELSYERDACQELVTRRMREILAEHGRDKEREARRRAAAEQIRFPHELQRRHQEDMLNAIEEGLASSGQVLVSAPPGIGKTAAALVAAVRHACSIGGRVFVATSKTTQQHMFAKTVTLMRAAGAPVRAVVLSAKSKACMNDVVHCHPDACEFAVDYHQKMQDSGAVARLGALPVADLSAIQAEAEVHRFCPFEAALDLTAEVDVVIGDYNYAFDPGAALKRMFVESEPDDVVLVIDEAHNLHDRGMGYYSPQLKQTDLRLLERRVAGSASPILRRVRGILRRLIDYIDSIGRGGGAPPPEEEEPPEAATENMLLFDDPQARAQERAQKRRTSGRLKAVRPSPPAQPQPSVDPRTLPPERVVSIDQPFLEELQSELGSLAVAWFAEGKATTSRGDDGDPVLQSNRLLSRFVSVAALDGDEFSAIYKRGDGGSLRILCKDPARQLARRIQACAGAVAVSATLEPLSFYRDVLGFSPDAVLRSFPSPFDRRRRRVLVLDRPSTIYKERERDLPIVDDAVRAVVAAHPGNYLVCCPSFHYLEKLTNSLSDLPRFEVLRQERGMDDAARAAVLERLHESGGRPPVLLLVVQGGIFTEGVDYPGEACVGAIVVGPGLPRVSFSRELIQQHFERAYGRGFEYAFLYPGINKVIQSAGRVIRTPTDKGVVVLVGTRFSSPRYADLFPVDWFEHSPRELICTDPYGELKRFWSEPLPEAGAG